MSNYKFKAQNTMFYFITFKRGGKGSSSQWVFQKQRISLWPLQIKTSRTVGFHISYDAVVLLNLLPACQVLFQLGRYSRAELHYFIHRSHRCNNVTELSLASELFSPGKAADQRTGFYIPSVMQSWLVFGVLFKVFMQQTTNSLLAMHWS